MATAAKTEEFTNTVRDMAEKGTNQAKESYDRFQSAASEASSAFESAFEKSSKNYKDLGQKSVEMVRANANAHFDFLNAYFGSKTLNEALELQQNYARQQLGVIADQAKEISSLAQKAVTESAKPLQDVASKSFRAH